jgi:hypothetical protein
MILLYIIEYVIKSLIMLPFDVLGIIFEFADFKTKINLISTCHYISTIFFITNLYNISHIYLLRLTQQTLETKIFTYVTKLYCRHIAKVRDVSFMKSLQILNVSGRKCNVDQKGIVGLNLIELNCNNNNKINDVSFMKSLKILNASGWFCTIDQKGIEGLDLIKLNCSSNANIKNVSFMTSLKKLHIRAGCGVDMDGIKNLDLDYLDCRFNKKIVERRDSDPDNKFIVKLKLIINNIKVRRLVVDKFD